MPTLSAGDDARGLERHDLLAQVDERADAVDERHDDRESRRERALVAPEALDDARACLRDDPDRPRRQEQHEDRDDDEDDDAGFHGGSCS